MAGNRITLTKADARKIILHASGLSRRAQFGRGREAAYKVIDHLGFLQADTNYIVERAHHHALASRIPGYQAAWLEELQNEGRIFEFWIYASGFIPMYEYRYSFVMKASLLARRKAITPAEAQMMRTVLDRIGRDGPQMSSDFENDRVTKSAGWWDWRPSKLALERLHFEGKLMTTRKGNFLKVYDLPENIIPGNIDMTHPSMDEFSRHYVLRSLKALGIASAKDVVFRGRYAKQNTMKQQLKSLVDSGEVCEVEIEGMKGYPHFMLSDYRKKKIKLSGDAFILSPFDNLNIYRSRLKEFFNFDYMVECFVPAPKRKYGYFALPILVGDTFVARMDSKADRKRGVLIIFNLHFENTNVSKLMIAKISEALYEFAKFNQCSKAELQKTNNRKATVAILTLLKNKL
jgi:uncharacterized protein YcaQ